MRIKNLERIAKKAEKKAMQRRMDCDAIILAKERIAAIKSYNKVLETANFCVSKLA